MTTKTHATHARHCATYAKACTRLKNSDHKVLYSAPVPIRKGALCTKFNLYPFKGGPSDRWAKIEKKNTKKYSLYSQSLLIVIYKTPVFESHPTTGEI